MISKFFWKQFGLKNGDKIKLKSLFNLGLKSQRLINDSKKPMNLLMSYNHFEVKYTINKILFNWWNCYIWLFMRKKIFFDASLNSTLFILYLVC